MEVLNPGGSRGRIVVFAPRWLEPESRSSTLGLPIEALSTASAAADAGFEVVFLDETREDDLEARLKEAIGGALLACAWTSELYIYQLRGILRFVSILEGLGNRVPVVVGGPLITICPRDILESWRGVSLFVHGMGEEVLPEIASRLTSGEDASAVPGTASHRADGLSWQPYTSPRTLSPEYGRFYRAFDLTPYVERDRNIFGNTEPTLKVRLARGCARRCGFCYHFQVRASRVEAKDAVEDLLYLHREYGVRQFTFHELDFFSDRERALQISDRLHERGAPIRWFALGSVSDFIRFGPEEVRRLKRGGCEVVEMGAESGSEAILLRIGKTHQPEDSVTAAARMIEGGISTVHNVIFGIPGETREDRRRTIALVKRLLALGPDRVLVHPRLYQVSPGTPLGDETMARYREIVFPHRIDDVVGYRAGFAAARTFAWMSEAEEREVKSLCLYYIPMMEASESLVPDRYRLVVRGLKQLTGLRVRTGFFGLPADRWLFDRYLRPRTRLVNAFAE